MTKLTRNLIVYSVATAVVLFVVGGWLIPVVGLSVQTEAVIDRASTQVAKPAPTLSPAQLAVPASVILDQVAAFEYLYVGKMPTSAVVVVSQDNETLTLAGYDIYKLPNTVVTLEVSGYAHAGYPTNVISVAVVDKDGQAVIIISLPPPEVLGWEMDINNTKTADVHEPLDIWILTIGAVREDTIDAINILSKDESLQKACEGGLLTGTNNEAIQFFRQWFRPDGDEAKYGYDSVEVLLSTPGDCP